MESENPIEHKYKNLKVDLHKLSEITPVPVHKHSRPAKENFPIAQAKHYEKAEVSFAVSGEIKKKPAKLTQEV